MRPLAAEEKKKPIKSYIFSNSFNSVEKKICHFGKNDLHRCNQTFGTKQIINKTN